MKNTYIIPVILLLLLLSFESYGQRWKMIRYEFALGGGSTHFEGDIGRANQNVLNLLNGPRNNAGLDFTYRITKDINAKLDLQYLWFSGIDIEGQSHNRVYKFGSHNFEHTVRGEYYFLGEDRGFGSMALYNRRGMINTYDRIFAYVFAGFGGIYSKGSVVDVNNNNAEPVDNPGYDNNSHYGLVLPVGLGLKYSLSSHWSLGLEVGYRWTSSDWLDAYSSAFSEYNDTYYTTSVKAIYRVRTDRRGRPMFNKYYR
ncbi:MAG: outer membrane beta-barrel protein [Bacteroidales bacterium]|nr:outer membrane beta-barrel protein [Bacteroidales bacterium]MBN2697308.1 outer membrane beta-barrel protein [Bacteroidales bacterium]